MIALALLGVPVLLSYLGWRIRPVPKGGRRLTVWEDAGLVVAFVLSQAFFGILTLVDGSDVLLIAYGALLVPVLATVVSRSTRPFVMAGLASAIYAEPLLRLYCRSIEVNELGNSLIPFCLVYTGFFFVTLLFICPIHHGLKTRHAI